MNFSDVIGQDQIKLQLKKILQENRTPHAFLFSGNVGCGAFPMAMAMATSLLCREKNANGDSCGYCKSCQMVKNLSHPDLHFVYPVISKKRGSKCTSDTYQEEWNTMLQKSLYFDNSMWFEKMGVENQQPQIGVAESESIVQKLSLSASQGGYKVMIIWQPERMNEETANKLLKILEEPPGNTVYILISYHPQKLLDTILSRTQQIKFPPLDVEDIRQALINKYAIDELFAMSIARSVQGNYVKALQQIQVSEENATFFDMFVQLMRLCYKRDIFLLNKWAERISEWGRERQKKFMEYCQHLIRENFIFNFKQPALNYETNQETDFSTRFARFINERNVYGITERISDVQRDIEANVNAKIVFFDFSLHMIVLLLQ